MLCEVCKRRLAEFSRKTCGGWGEEKLAVCEECAKKIDLEQSDITFADLFWGAEKKISKCAVCGTTIDEIKRTKYVGCKECYKIFGDAIEGLTASIHGKSFHVGRMPLSVSNRLDRPVSAADMMSRAIETSDYDIAAAARSRFPGGRRGLDGN